MVEDMLAEVGFNSSDLAAITMPVLAISGGRSCPRLQHQDECLVKVIPQARAEVFSERSHLSSPHGAEPARLAEMLIEFWTQALPVVNSLNPPTAMTFELPPFQPAIR
jgi:pimeloyl-ACP methyl ester carboxylesterase